MCAAFMWVYKPKSILEPWKLPGIADPSPDRLAHWDAGSPVQALLQVSLFARHGGLAAALAVAVPAVLGPGGRDHLLAHQRAAHQGQALALALAIPSNSL